MSDSLTPALLQVLADSPLPNERTGKIWLPLGKKAAPRTRKPDQIDSAFAPKITNKEARERAASAKDKKLGSILTYYAGTDIPFERIVAHTKLDLVTVIRAMKARGRDQ